jgi:hypothetical protein
MSRKYTAARALMTLKSARASRLMISRWGRQMRRSCMTSFLSAKMRSRVSRVGCSKTSTCTIWILSSMASRLGK